jgi:hypothetical protein
VGRVATGIVSRAGASLEYYAGMIRSQAWLK